MKSKLDGFYMILERTRYYWFMPSKNYNMKSKTRKIITTVIFIPTSNPRMPLLSPRNPKPQAFQDQ